MLNEIQKRILQEVADLAAVPESGAINIRSNGSKAFRRNTENITIDTLSSMFFISKSSSNPTIIDYERKLQDKYASWESDLKEKEQELKDFEWELKELGVDFNK